jgi:hypothetical protein
MTEQSHDRQNEATRCCNHAGLLASFRMFAAAVTRARISVLIVPSDGTKPRDGATMPFSDLEPRRVSSPCISPLSPALRDESDPNLRFPPKRCRQIATDIKGR